MAISIGCVFVSASITLIEVWLTGHDLFPSLYLALLTPALIAPPVTFILIKLAEQLGNAEQGIKISLAEKEALLKEILQLNENLESQIELRTKKLSDSEKRYRNLFETANDSIFIIDPKTHHILDANKSATRRLGYSRQELLQMSIPDIRAPEDAGIRESIEENLSKMGNAIAETRHVRKDGSLIPVEFSTRTVDYGGHEVLESFVRDITERKKVEEIQKRFLNALDDAPEGIILWDAEDRFVMCNKRHRELRPEASADWLVPGVRFADYIRRRAQGGQIVPARGREEEWIAERMASHRNPSGEHETSVGDRWFSVRETKLADGGLIVFHTDITERKLAEAQAREAIAKRMEAEEISRQRYDQLVHVARVNSLGEMASGLAHEINQPLLAIRSYAEGCLHHLRSGAINKDELLEVIGDVAVQAGRAGDIIQKIRELLRKEEGQTEEFDINVAIKNVIDLLGGEFKESDMSIILDLAEPLREVKADRIQMEQVILNIARNGIEAMGENGTADRRMLCIRSSADDLGNVEVSVEDSGHDFHVVDPEIIFEPFFTTKKEGLGMGLAICRTIVESQGGRIWAAANASGGATISFTMPAQD